MSAGLVRDLLRQGTERLRAAGIPDPARDARLLLAEALGVAGGSLGGKSSDGVTAAEAVRFEDLVGQRVRFRPVSQILGRRAFWKHEFQVTGAVLDPRPETELLVELALESAAARRILDLGTGSGAIILSLLHDLPEASGVGGDVSAEALEVARANAQALGLSDRVAFVRSDWFSNIDGEFDLVVCNPPYISETEMADLSRDVRDWEPHVALTPGVTGVEAYERIASELRRFMAPGGRALFEIGADQGQSVGRILSQSSGGEVRLYRDLNGCDRIIELKL